MLLENQEHCLLPQLIHVTEVIEQHEAKLNCLNTEQINTNVYANALGDATKDFRDHQYASNDNQAALLKGHDTEIK